MYGFPYFIRNQRFKDIFLQSKEMRKLLKNIYKFPYFIKNQRFKDTFLRRKEIKEILN